MRNRILVVEDEPTINQAVTDRLVAEGFTVLQAYDGPSAVDAAAAEQPDLVVLDVMLPGFDGHEVCRRVQAERPVPVLMLTARDDETDILVGLGVGADDYLTKPFSMRELVARVRVLLRRVERARELSKPAPRIDLGPLGIDRARREVTVDGVAVHLTPTEFDLLVCLARQPGTVLTREHLLAEVWDWADATGTRTVDSHVKSLRGKIGAALVRTVHESGTHLRPLDPVRSIRTKLGILIAVTVALAAVTPTLANLVGLRARYAIPIAVLAALVVTQILARGMTSPLREMTAAAQEMARGSYGTRVTATSRDEVGELARAFNTMAADLEAVDRQRRELIANVSHELRTPVSALNAVLENLVDGVAAPSPETLHAALEQTSRLSRLVSDLLDLSRVDAGITLLEREDVPVGRFLTDAVAQARLAGRPVAYVVEAEPGLVVHADRGRLHQLVANLLDNASRHSPPGGTVVARASTTADNTLLEVTDEGPGIAESERAAVFERFTTGGTGDGSTGLGLAIARWVTALHGGSIEVVDSTTGCHIRATFPHQPQES